MYKCESCLPPNSKIFRQAWWKREQYMSIRPSDVNFSEQMSAHHPASYPIGLWNPWPFNIERNNMDSIACPCLESSSKFYMTQKKNDITNIPKIYEISERGFQPQGQVGQKYIPLPLVHPTYFKQQGHQFSSRYIPPPVHPSCFQQSSLSPRQISPPVPPSSYEQKSPFSPKQILVSPPSCKQGHLNIKQIPPQAIQPYKPYKDSITNSKNYSRNQICRFCLQNGETEEYYSNHQLKNRNGKVTCPVLRRYVCDICKATGDSAHTRAYCPFYEEKNKKPLAVILKQTYHDSCGRIRK